MVLKENTICCIGQTQLGFLGKDVFANVPLPPSFLAMETRQIKDVHQNDILLSHPFCPIMID
jgi:hypothetical protein